MFCLVVHAQAVNHFYCTESTETINFSDDLIVSVHRAELINTLLRQLLEDNLYLHLGWLKTIKEPHANNNILFKLTYVVRS